jgi:dTDP-4-amino-4,6-dideoxygalactose transaminase
LYAQLESSQRIQSRRRRIWSTYNVELATWARQQGARLPVVPEYCGQAYHMYYLLLPCEAERRALMAHLKSRGILSVFHYLPLHLSEMGRRFGGRAGDCPVTESISERLLRLPFYNGLDAADQMRVIEAVTSFRIR